jgi:YesN/AraC family two-component response regulator
LERVSELRPTRIVIADDDALLRSTIRRLLERYGHQVVGEAYDGATAIEIAENVKPDLILLDVSMPVMDGFEAARVVKERMPEVRLIFVSGHSDPHHHEEAVRLGASDYIPKVAVAR